MAFPAGPPWSRRPHFSLTHPAAFDIFFRSKSTVLFLLQTWTLGLLRRSVRRREFGARRSQVAGKTPKKVTGWRQVGLLSSIPFILALAPIIGLVIGQQLERRFRTPSWLTYVLCGLGFVAGVRETIKIVKLSQQED
ncbi:MAG: AtpZ/AtpI family protein [Candidatus Eisenbacteria bacterium]|uniref:AtpZ/AtpI family protein n=1 Tax=Eiseniibacteriota bacterium TaxID=2212470 RepID=A0A538TEY8_UNCEI|nr:MAG: AtpZ/AtpI family protein [Candidatus Eisenbacteria bacterium]